MIESRQRGIVITLARDIDESVKLSNGDGDRTELPVVCDVTRLRDVYIGDDCKSIDFSRLVRYRSDSIGEHSSMLYKKKHRRRNISLY